MKHTCLCTGWHSSSVGWTASEWRMCWSPCQVPALPAAAQRAAAQRATRRQLPPGHGPVQQQPTLASAKAAATAAGRDEILPEVHITATAMAATERGGRGGGGVVWVLQLPPYGFE